MHGLLAISLCALMSCASDDSSLSIAIGPTAIPRGDAVAANDITVSNGLFAVAGFGEVEIGLVVFCPRRSVSEDG